MTARRDRPRAGRPPRKIGIAIVVLCLVGYGGVVKNGFVAGDDPGYVTENPHVTAGLTASSLGWAFVATEQSNWHPLTWVSHMLDVALFGVHAGPHHAVSLAIHVANALLLFFLFARMTSEPWLSGFVAALFAVHPIHVESVAYIAERKDVLSALFWLLSLWAWLRFLESRTASRYLLVMLGYACGLMSKPMLVTFPFTLLLLDVWPLRRFSLRKESMDSIPALLTEKIPLFVMAVVSSIVTMIAQSRGGAVQSLTDLGVGERIGNALVAYGSYLGKVFWPSSLSPFYPRPEHGFGAFYVTAAALLLAAMTGISIWLGRRASYVLVGWLWFVGTMIPVIGLVQVGDQAMADRYTYLPSIGIFVICVWGAAELVRTALPRSTRMLAAAAGVIIIVLTLLTRVQATYWSTSATLYTHALAVNPDDYVAHNQLGLALYAAGRKQEALEHYARAVEIKPGYANAHNNLGAVLAEQGRFDEAIQHYERALAYNPSHAKALNNLGLALASTGRIPEAIQKWQDAIRVDPGFADAHSNLGVALARSGRMGDAAAEFEAALRISPDHPMAKANLARIRGGK